MLVLLCLDAPAGTLLRRTHIYVTTNMLKKTKKSSLVTSQSVVTIVPDTDITS